MDGSEFQQAMVDDLPVVELISVVVGCYDVQQEDVFGLRVQSGDAKLHLWEHLSVNCNLETVGSSSLDITLTYRVRSCL